MAVIGTRPARIDIDAWAHAPVDFSVPVLDALAVPVPSLASWSVAAKAAPTGMPDVALTVAIDGLSVRVTATPAQTAVWFDTWPSRAAPWDLVLTDPDGTPLPPLCAGWIRVYPTRAR